MCIRDSYINVLTKNGESMVVAQYRHPYCDLYQRNIIGEIETKVDEPAVYRALEYGLSLIHIWQFAPGSIPERATARAALRTFPGTGLKAKSGVQRSWDGYRATRTDVSARMRRSHGRRR